MYKAGGDNIAPPVVPKNCGFVFFKDRSVLLFYTNDLAGARANRIYRNGNHAQMCVNGFAPLGKQFGNESLRCKILNVPTIMSYCTKEASGQH